MRGFMTRCGMGCGGRRQSHGCSRPEHDRRGERDGGEEGLGASATAGCGASPILQTAEHDLDPVVALVDSDGLSARRPAGGARPFAFVFQRIPEPFRIMAAVGDQPSGCWQAVQQGRSADAAADLTCRINPSSPSHPPDQTPALIAGAPFSPAGSKPCDAPSDTFASGSRTNCEPRARRRSGQSSARSLRRPPIDADQPLQHFFDQPLC